MAVSLQVVIDCADPGRLARFWAIALGYAVEPPPAEYDSWETFLAANDVPQSEWNSASAVVDPDGAGPRIFFQRVPEPKMGKNRVHVDVNISGGPSTPIEDRRRRLQAERDRLQQAGAEVIGPVEERGEYWIVLKDPEGNEFCIQ